MIRCIFPPFLDSLSYHASPQVEMTLTIRDLREEDFGNYSCMAKNPRGETDGFITLTGEEFHFPPEFKAVL